MKHLMVMAVPSLEAAHGALSLTAVLAVAACSWKLMWGVWEKATHVQQQIRDSQL